MSSFSCSALFLASAHVQSSFTYATATNQHFRRLLGKRCACLTVSSRKWTHTDFSLQAQREIWSCVSLISCTTEFEGKQAEFRFVWEQCCIVVEAALSWSSKSPCCRHSMCCMNGPDCSDITKISFLHALLIYSQSVTQQHSLCNCFYKCRLNACFRWVKKLYVFDINKNNNVLDIRYK